MSVTTVFKYAALTSLMAFMVVVNSLASYANVVVEPIVEATEEQSHLSAVESDAETELSSTETVVIANDAIEFSDAIDGAIALNPVALNPFDQAIEEMNWVDSWTDASETEHSLSGMEFSSHWMEANEPIAAESSDVALSPAVAADLTQGNLDDVVPAPSAVPDPTDEMQRYSTNALDLTQPIAQAQTTLATSAHPMSNEPDVALTTVPTLETATPEAETIAQVLSPGQPTRSGPSYIGAGGNIGFGGSTGIGRGNFALFSKLGLTNNFSLRPAAFIGDRTTFLVPVTLDFPTGALVDDAVPFSIAPYAGGGIGVSTGDDSRVRPVIVAGVDAPVSNQFTATAGVTVGFFRNTEVGLLLGIGYNFGGF